MCKSSLELIKEDLERNVEERKRTDKDGWKALTTFQEISRDVRQDRIIEEKTQENLVKYPLRPSFGEEELRKLDILDTYNTTAHLANLSMVAHAVNERFHGAIREIFEIDEKSGISRDQKIKYRCGPIKDLKRSKMKTENDYSTEAFPSSTKVIDFVRGSMVFTKCGDCVEALGKLIKVVNSGRTCLKRIGRIKNMLVFPSFDKHYIIPPLRALNF